VENEWFKSQKPNLEKPEKPKSKIQTVSELP